MENGILSHAAVARRQVSHVDISDAGVQRWRRRCEPVFHRAINEYVPLYFNPRNAMLFSRRAIQHELVVLVFSRARLAAQPHLYADGNAACRATRFARDASFLREARDVLLAPHWTAFADGRRRRCAEMLVHGRIAAARIDEVLCPSEHVAQALSRRHAVSVRVVRGLYFD